MSEVKKRYELVVLFRAELEAKLDDSLKKVADLITANGGEIVSEDNWGRKELAYKIAGETHAIYRVYQLDLPAAAPAKIEANLNINNDVIRHLLTKVDAKAEAAIKDDKERRAAREAAKAEREATEK